MAVCELLFKEHDIAPGVEDEYGLNKPLLACPSFSDSAKQHASKPYDEVPAGYLRSALWVKPAFWRDATSPQKAWVSYLVCRRGLEKLEQAAAEAALGEQPAGEAGAA